MKTAVLHIAVLEFTCPHCKEHLSNEDGSHLFPTHQAELPETLTCDSCGEVVKVPAKAKKIAYG